MSVMRCRGAVAAVRLMPAGVLMGAKVLKKNVTGSALSVYFTAAGVSAYPLGYAGHGLLALVALAKGGKAEVALAAGPEAHSGGTYH